MQSDPNRATAEGMPLFTRRSILGHGAVTLAGGAAIALSVPDMEARATVAHDPMLALIKEHRAANSRLNQPLLEDDDEIDAYAEAVINPIREAIEARPAITTEAGAREAIRETLSEFTICNQFEKSLLLAALAYLDGRA